MEPEEITQARYAYARYGAVTDYLNLQGNPMPTWDELPAKIQQAWVAAARYPVSPSSLNADIAKLIYGGTDEVSDGYHTFGELYDHRITLFIALCGYVSYDGFNQVWRTRKHSDGTEMQGWFLLGITNRHGQQLSYHLPNRYWAICQEQIKGYGFKMLDQAPDFDGHTSADVLTRLFTL